MNREILQAHVRTGFKPEFLFFWGHTGKEGVLGKECLSQWYPAPFRVVGGECPTAEHYMMCAKARLFNDQDAAARVLSAATPAEAKAIGRSVKNFDDEVWKANCVRIVEQGNFLKFSQNPELGNFLLSTGDKILVEASNRDPIWGIGHHEQDSRARHPLEWRGLNLLGFALMATRSKLRSV